MPDITEVLQERIRSLSLDIAKLEELENSPQDPEWVVVDTSQMSQSATPHPPDIGDEHVGEPDPGAETNHSTAMANHKFQSDATLNRATNERDVDENTEMGLSESATPRLTEPPREINSAKETTTIKSETYINRMDDGTIQEENMSQTSDIPPYKDAPPSRGDTPPPQYDEISSEQLPIIKVERPTTPAPEAPKPEPQRNDDVFLRYEFKKSFKLNDDQYLQVKEKLIQEIFNSDIWQTWEFISEEDRALQVAALRCDVLFRDYKLGHCLNNEIFRVAEKMVTFDSYVEQLVDLCCRQWCAVEDGDEEERGKQVVRSEVLPQDIAEDICRNFSLIGQI